jgi:DNA-binding MurR/RpiR family transcriptional regulator
VELGYDGYPSMQKALQEMIRNKLTSVQRIEVANDRFGNQEILTMVLQSDIEKIRTTLEEVDKVAFQAAVDAILEAKTIYILGVRSSASIASFLSFYFNLMFQNVKHIHTSSNAEMFEQMVRISKDDVVIGISFPRYSSRTVKAMKFAYDRGATVIALTDSMSSPIAQNATHTLIAMSDMVSLVDSLVAPLSVVNALIVACSYKKEDEISETFSNLETIWDEYGVYEKVDDGV